MTATVLAASPDPIFAAIDAHKCALDIYQATRNLDDSRRCRPNHC
jgi:hypothetical protein